MMASPPPRLFSIGPSHYCEKARWALHRAGVEVTETKHVPVLHFLAVKGKGKGTSCPKLVIAGTNGEEQKCLDQSSDIVHYADEHISEEDDRLYPSDEATRKRVEEWETKFDKLLGPHVRLWLYSYLLFDKLSYKLLSAGVSAKEKTAAWPLMPVIRRGIAGSIKMNKPGAREASLKQIHDIFQEVEAVLADGRPFICGDRFTAADLTFAALGAGMVAAPEYGAWLPSLDDYPRGLVEEVKRLQETVAGKFILRVYSSLRHQVVGSKTKT